MLENQRLEQVLAALLETAGDAILGIALDGSIFLWSQGAEHLYGYTTAELAGQWLTALAAPLRRASAENSPACGTRRKNWHLRYCGAAAEG